jgi:prefoldin subunit 5
MRYTEAREILAEAIEQLETIAEAIEQLETMAEAYEGRMNRLRTAYEKGRKSGKDVSSIQKAAGVNADKRERRLRSIGSKVATEPGLDKMFKAGQAVSWNKKLQRGKLHDKQGNIPYHLRWNS